ncbi:hypothetical protein HPP92_002702 [Vanilla planifolia]|uniref:Anaphase-promoting complex subunit 4-like WD40 domain-containing protein n=1 Tax=Vanilla planifolia TaxID=51239 RepID=A0A835VML6_VANPL|nr:hypothetical protein HPP92_002702 [Vanilla planifolia]
MISSLCWVPKGASKVVPVVADPPSKEEIEELLRTELSYRSGDADDDEDEVMDVDTEPVDDVAHAVAAAKALNEDRVGKSEGAAHSVAKGIEELNMDAYDDEDGDIELFGSGIGDSYYPSDGTMKGRIPNLETAKKGLLDWMLEDRGNFLAVGSIEPAIEIWDLDLIDEVQPFLVLGGVSKKKNKGKKKTIVYRKDSHRDAVLGLAWNKEVRNVLASASADKSVKIWDMVTGKCVATVDHHTDKVQTVAWNRQSPELLLSGSFDKSVVMVDAREVNKVMNKWSVMADVESLAWNPHVDYSFVVSQENGVVQGFDIRVASSDKSSSGDPLFTLFAHDKAASAICYNPYRPNLLASGSTDKMVKLWDLSNNQPSCIASTNPKAGSIFSMAFSEDCPTLLAIGGLKGKPTVWDITSEAEVAQYFEKGTNQGKAPSPDS